MGVYCGVRAEIENLLYVNTIQTVGEKFLNTNISQGQDSRCRWTGLSFFYQRFWINQVRCISLERVSLGDAGSSSQLLLRFTGKMQLLIYLSQAEMGFRIAIVEHEQVEQGIASASSVSTINLYLRQA